MPTLTARRAQDAVDRVVAATPALSSKALKQCETLTTGLVGLEGGVRG